jgi:hypothetical protein
MAIKNSIKKAKKESLEALDATEEAQEEVIEVAEKSKGKKQKVLTRVARDLEKAIDSAGKSCEATEEAEFKAKEI